MMPSGTKNVNAGDGRENRPPYSILKTKACFFRSCAVWIATGIATVYKTIADQSLGGRHGLVCCC